MKCQPSANLWWPSSKASGPPPLVLRSCRQASAATGTSHAVRLLPGLLLIADRHRRADRARFDQLLRLHHRRVEDEILEDAEDALRRLRPLDQPVGVGDRGGHHLLERDVLAGIHRRKRRIAVEMMRAGGCRRRRRVRRRGVRGSRCRSSRRGKPQARARFSARSRFDIGDGDDLGIGVGLIFERMQVGDAPGADETGADPVERGGHCSFPPLFPGAFDAPLYCSEVKGIRRELPSAPGEGENFVGAT